MNLYQANAKKHLRVLILVGIIAMMLPEILDILLIKKLNALAKSKDQISLKLKSLEFKLSDLRNVQGRVDSSLQLFNSIPASMKNFYTYTDSELKTILIEKLQKHYISFDNQGYVSVSKESAGIVVQNLKPQDVYSKSIEIKGFTFLEDNILQFLANLNNDMIGGFVVQDINISFGQTREVTHEVLKDVNSGNFPEIFAVTIKLGYASLNKSSINPMI